MKKVLVIRMVGKVGEVFPLLAALAKKRGDMTLGEIIKERRKADDK